MIRYTPAPAAITVVPARAVVQVGSGVRIDFGPAPVRIASESLPAFNRAIRLLSNLQRMSP